MRRGYTLVELAVAIAIAGSILQLAMQGYASWRRTASVQRMASRVGALLVRARTEARTSGLPYRLRFRARENVLEGHRAELTAGGKSSGWVLDRSLQLEPRSELSMPLGRDVWFVDAGGAVLDAEGRVAEEQTLAVRIGSTGLRREIQLSPDGELKVGEP